MIDIVEREASRTGHPPALEAILSALIYPMVEMGFRSRHHRIFMHLLGRCFGEANPEVQALLHQNAEKIRRRFAAALLRAEPRLTTVSRRWEVKTCCDRWRCQAQW